MGQSRPLFGDCKIVESSYSYSILRVRGLKQHHKRQLSMAVVVAQLVERSLPIPEVRGSNPVIGTKLLNIYLLSTVLKIRK